MCVFVPYPHQYAKHLSGGPPARTSLGAAQGQTSVRIKGRIQSSLLVSRLSGGSEWAMLSYSLTTAEVPLSKALGVAKCLTAVDCCEIEQIPIIKVKHGVGWVLMLSKFTDLKNKMSFTNQLQTIAQKLLSPKAQQWPPFYLTHSTCMTTTVINEENRRNSNGCCLHCVDPIRIVIFLLLTS